MRGIGRRAGALAAAGALALPAVVAGAAAPAAAKDTEVVARGTCTPGGTWTLKAKPDDGRVEWEFEVDTGRAGQTWLVAVTDNWVPVFAGRRTTAGASGSFTVERTSSDRRGTDTIRAVASRGGAVCVGRVRL